MELGEQLAVQFGHGRELMPSVFLPAAQNLHFCEHAVHLASVEVDVERIKGKFSFANRMARERRAEIFLGNADVKFLRNIQDELDCWGM